MKNMIVALMVVAGFAWSTGTLAQDAHGTTSAPTLTPKPAPAPDQRAAQPIRHGDAHASNSAAGQPVLPRDAAWAGVMVIVIVGGFFLPAAVIGPIARALAPEEEAERTSQDEHGGSHHHPTDAHAPHGRDAHEQHH